MNGRGLHFSAFHYFIDVIPLWNSLSSNVINSSAVSLFKKQIRCLSVRQLLSYMYTVEPPKKGHFGTRAFGPCREVGLCRNCMLQYIL